MPFGLRVVDGTTPLGRPAAFDGTAYLYNGEPVEARMLRAAYQVTADDPVAVFHEWVEQLRWIVGDRWVVTAGEQPGDPWLTAENFVDRDPAEGLVQDGAEVQLWASTAEPVLLVWIDSGNREGDRRSEAAPVSDATGTAPNPNAAVDAGERGPGDLLFNEQGGLIQLPEGTQALMPTIPRTWGGAGGSTSLLAADDADAALRAMIDEAQTYSDYAKVDDIAAVGLDCVEVIRRSFNIPAGGWSFEMLAVHQPDDPYATIYVTSWPG